MARRPGRPPIKNATALLSQEFLRNDAFFGDGYTPHEPTLSAPPVSGTCTDLCR